MRTRLLTCPMLVAAYAICGKLGLLMAVPPGYASPIFPPAGIAVAAVLIGGHSVLPCVFLGSFLLNVWTGSSFEHLPTSIAAAVIIGLSSMLQAAAGGAVLRRAVGYPTAFDNGRDLSRFLLLSPVYCLISATLSLSGVWAIGVVPWSDLLTSWVSWWIGDTLGVLVVLPLMLVAVGQPRDLWRRRTLPVALPMLLFFALFVTIYARVSKWEHDEVLLDFHRLSQQVVDKIRSGLEEQEIFLEQLKGSFSGPAPLSRKDFGRLVHSLLRRFPTIQAVKWAPEIDLPQHAFFEAAQQGDQPGFRIREINPSRQRRPAGERERSYPVTYVEPLKGNEHIVGYDLASETGRKAAIDMTLRTGTAAATPPIRLIQERGEQLGILLLLAVPGGPNGAGLVGVALRMGTFMDGLLAPMNTMLKARLVDVEARKALYAGFTVVPADASQQNLIVFGGRRYAVQTAPTSFYQEQHRGWDSWAVLVAGVFSTGLLGASLMLGTGYTRRIEIEVDERTTDLAAMNQRLKLEIKERRHAEAALRQAQRMEAIGQLTGGVAHDFNNLLTVVSGNAELLHDNAPTNTIRSRASAIMVAADRGARLTRQLLAFSRSQAQQAETTDLRQRTREIADMLSRSLRADIEVTVEMPPDLWPVAIDPAEFELALLNVAVNARDAMPSGGRFQVAARNVSCGIGVSLCHGLVGDFIAVTMSDTGAGMEPDVQARAFEPYFTTKVAGLGSGLGLFQVYGFTKQSGGTATIESMPGKGTSITLFLPRATERAATASTAAPNLALPQTAARILFVEDDIAVARVTAELLRDIGYDAVEALDAAEALVAIERDPTIKLVMSDIVMPGTNGLDLARTLRLRYPELPILLATGYSQYSASLLDEGFPFVAKPYRREVLVAAIGQALGRVRPARQ
jgi:signal transduction histidine kinase/CheY-like chemotaxis protein